MPDAQLTTSRWPPLPMTTARLRARSRSSMLMAKRTVGVVCCSHVFGGRFRN